MFGIHLFPDPAVIVQIGPFALRWYALSYIGGLLIGWRLLRGLVRRTPAVADERQVDDYLTWAILGVVLGGRLGYVLFYQPGRFLADPVQIWMYGRGAWRSTAGSSALRSRRCCSADGSISRFGGLGAGFRW